MTHHHPLEVLSPAGDRERLENALRFGADAVYLSGKEYGMRSACSNFSREDLIDAVEYTHQMGKKLYVTCNILPRNHDIYELPDYLTFCNDIGVDALIISDFGAMKLAEKFAPNCALHISTQFGVVNYATANALYEMGAKRVVLARELSLDEIREIRALTPPELELEAFVHGAICMSYSGRCVISNYLTNRDANHGECAQPCRWKYHITEDLRPDMLLTVEQDENGTYLFNANDMNMIAHIAQLADAGISSFKIEGRAKSFYYTAVTANAYRQAVDGYLASNRAPSYKPDDWVIEELNKVSHRPYGTGFYFGEPNQHQGENGYIRAYDVAGTVDGWDNGVLKVVQRNRFFDGDALEVLQPGVKPYTITVKNLCDADKNPIDTAPHPMMTVYFSCDKPIATGSLLRYDKNK